MLIVAGAIDCVAEKIVELVDEMEALAGKLDAIVDPSVVLGDPEAVAVREGGVVFILWREKRGI